jgi:penicillin-binding protein 2
LASTGQRAHPDRFLPPDPRVEGPYRLTPKVALRVAILGVIVLGLFAVLFLRLWALQVLSGERYLHNAVNNQLRLIRVEAPRGPIVDRNGRLLVTNVAGTAVLLRPSDLPKRAGRDTELRRLSAVLGVPFETIIAKIKGRAGDPLTPITLQVAVHKDQVAYLLEHKREFPGVELSQTYLRRYLAESLAAHILGYTGEVSPTQLKRLREQSYPLEKRPHAGDTIGQAGVEATYDLSLRGTPGVAQLQVDSLGRPRSQPVPGQNAEPGEALRLTVDISLQRAAERALRYGIQVAREDGHWAANGGAIVAMDPRDGAILAMASNPTYKPGVWVGRLDPKRLAPLLDAKTAKEANYPGLNRAINVSYPAGSTFKPVTALAAMKENLVSPYDPLQCTPDYVVRGETGAGQVFKNWDPYVNRPMTMVEAIEASCDTYFYQLGYAFYGLPENRGHPLQEWANRFGFGVDTGIDVGPESQGLLPTPEWRQRTFTKASDPCCWQIDRLWKPGDSIQLAIGQKDLLVTPLQMTRFYAMVANGGKLVTPHVVMDVEEPGDNRSAPKVLQRFPAPVPQPTGLDPATLAVVRDGLYRATHGENGTATSIFGNYPIPIAGKTGTAEKVVHLQGYEGIMDQSWWCGYAPADNPTISVCALIENGGHGGTAAAPAALKVFEHFFRLPGVYVPPTNSD